MFGSRTPPYIPLLIGGVLVSQVVPTFGARLGFTGNWIPFFVGLALVVPGVALYLLRNDFSDRIIRLTFFLYWILAVGHTLALMLVYSELTTVAEYADVARWLSVPVFLLAGFIYGRKAQGPLRGLFRIAIVLMAFTALLFADFVAGPWSGLQRFYVHRQIGLGRFPGNWNYPYDLSVALFFYSLVFGLAVVRARTQKYVAMGVGAIGVCILWIVIGQSRGSLLALGVTSGVGAIHVGARVLERGRVSVSTKPVTAAGVTLGAVLLGYAVIDMSLADLLGSYAARLVSLAAGGFVEAFSSPERVGELQRMATYFADAPLNLLWGFGPYRGGEFWIQNILLLVFRYGVLGFAGYILLIPVLTLRRGITRGRGRWLRRATIAYAYWLVFIFANSISHDIFSHYRFIPLFYFVTGVLIAVPGREYALAVEATDHFSGEMATLEGRT